MDAYWATINTDRRLHLPSRCPLPDWLRQAEEKAECVVEMVNGATIRIAEISRWAKQAGVSVDEARAAIEAAGDRVPPPALPKESLATAHKDSGGRPGPKEGRWRIVLDKLPSWYFLRADVGPTAPYGSRKPVRVWVRAWDECLYVYGDPARADLGSVLDEAND